MYEVIVDGEVKGTTENPDPKIEVVPLIKWEHVAPTLAVGSCGYIRVTVDGTLIGFLNDGTFNPMQHNAVLLENTEATTRAGFLPK